MAATRTTRQTCPVEIKTSVKAAKLNAASASGSVEASSVHQVSTTGVNIDSLHTDANHASIARILSDRVAKSEED
jgi:hypothetical protein